MTHVSHKLKSFAEKFKYKIRTCQFVLQHPRTPKLSKWLLGFAVGYALLPFDLIPDFIPVIGYLDDAIILPGLIFIAWKITPKEILEECRQKAKDEQTTAVK
jgi:uncharacterized membrane protein YkvA (DUF1232 family)